MTTLLLLDSANFLKLLPLRVYPLRTTGRPIPVTVLVMAQLLALVVADHAAGVTCIDLDSVFFLLSALWVGQGAYIQCDVLPLDLG